MNRIIALWCHPRSMSTAIERIMRERGDCSCFHEPFMYDYYIHRGVRAMPHFDVEPDRPVAYAEIRNHLLEAAESATVFIKDMSYYVVPALFDDTAFAQRLTHAFLIRHPARSILSYHRLDPDLTLEEIGLEAQWRHYEWLQDNLGMDPVVLEAEAIRQDPEAAMRTFWTAVGLSFAGHALAWQDDRTPEDWGQVAGWHGAVSGSTSIKPAVHDGEEHLSSEFAAAVARAPHLEAFLAHHLPFYERLRAKASSA